MILVWAYLAYVAVTAIFAMVASQIAECRALLAGSRCYQICVVFAWYDFWCGCFYDRKLHRIYFFPIPMVGVCVDFDAPC